MSVGVESGFSTDELLHIRFPLHRACRDGDVGALRSLLQQCSASRADLDAEDSFYGWTPIHWAAHFGKLECVLQLVQVGCEVNAITSRFAQTPAHIAAFGGHPECLLWLMQAGADVNRQDYVGETPIHKAARAGSLECINALLFSGAIPELKNTNGLTAADLACAQGFRQCAQLLSKAENKLKQHNKFGHNGTDHAHIQGRSLLNGAVTRKRLLDCSEPNHIKKARTDSMDFHLKTLNGLGEEVESMAVEPASDSLSGGTGPLPPMPTDSEHHEDSVAMESLSPTPQPLKATPEASMPVPWRYGSIDTATSLRNGHVQQKNCDETVLTSNGLCHATHTEPDHVETRNDMCGSLHLSSSPSSCVSYRPSWGRFPSDPSEHLHYGYYHGFGDTAEDLEDAKNRHDHNTSVRVEQHYDQEVLSAMQLFHGS